MQQGEFNPDEVRLLFRISKKLLTERSYGELLDDILGVTIDGLGAERGCVIVRHDGQLRAATARNFGAGSLEHAEREISGSIADSVLGAGKTLLLDDALHSQEFRGKPSVRRLQLRSVLCAPLVASSQAFAIIYLENRTAAHSFNEHHRCLLDEICSLAAPRLHAAVEMQIAQRRVREVGTWLGEADGIVTADAGMIALLRSLQQVAITDLPVLIIGETGTGKELLARAVYRQSARSNGPFLVMNCAAIPATLIESELFGYLQGAFTGAVRDRMGLLAGAHRGTLFLDEIGELPLELQPRLLRALQSGEFTRLGSVRNETADVRFVAASNRDLERETEEGRFRSDLFYRLSSITLKVPPLRERPHDIQLLSEHFLRAYAARFGREAPHLDEGVLAAFAAYSWPGNVRELEGEIARLVATSPSGSEIGVESLNPRIRRADADAGQVALPLMSLAELEQKMIASALESTGGNRSQAAEILGISREGLRIKMQRFAANNDSAGHHSSK
jgi:transcriptional regulator with GAF, ATPase, and Fis domain